MTTTSHRLLEIAEDFTANYVDPLLRRHFPELYSKIMVIVGGSVSYGLADEESDIDYGMIVESADVPAEWNTIVLDALGRRFHKHRDVLIDIHLLPSSSFGGYHLLSGDPALSNWERVDPTDLFLLQTMCILRDPEGKLHALKKRVEDIPQVILERRIVGRWGFLNLWLDYVRQCIQRSDPVGALIFVGRAMQEIMMLGFLLNGRPYPDPKYRFKIFVHLPVFSDQISPILEEVSSTSDQGRQYHLLHRVAQSYADHMARNKKIDAKYIDDWLQCFDSRNQALL